MNDVKLIFERSCEGKGLGLLPALDVPEAALPDGFGRKTAPRLPELSETEISRH